LIEFIFMLTQNDATVPNALEVLAEVRDAGLRYIGFKDVGQPPEVLTEIAARSHDAGLEVMLEVVSTSAEDELSSVRAALDIGVDWVLGGTHPDEAGAILAGTDVRYCPFPGTIVGHPSVLEGAPEAIAAHAGELTARPGVHGVDLLAYRHPDADPVALTRRVVEAASGPVIVAGSIVGADQVRRVEDAGAWGFTIGGAIFDERLPGAPSVCEQVARVLDIDVVADGARAPR
jgi:DhnA family fructose-bisphosphate aldolase class Ia